MALISCSRHKRALAWLLLLLLALPLVAAGTAAGCERPCGQELPGCWSLWIVSERLELAADETRSRTTRRQLHCNRHGVQTVEISIMTA